MPIRLDPILTLPPPLETGITPTTAHGLSFLFAASYVGSLYLAPLLIRSVTWAPKGASTTAVDAAHNIPMGHRDHPQTMRMRMRAVSWATRLSVVGIYWTVKTVGDYDYEPAVRILLPPLFSLESYSVIAKALPSLDKSFMSAICRS